MRGGSNRLPRAVKAARGTLRKHRENANAPQLDPSEVPRPPRRLNAIERSIWRELKPQIDRLGVYDPSCFTALRLLVQTLALVESDDSEKKMPATARVRLAQVAAGMMTRFGLDPSSRDRVSTRHREEDDEEERMFGLRAVPGGAE